MNTKSIFASLLISLSFMASCQQFDIAEAPFQEEEKQMSADYNMSSKGNEDVEFAYVRVGVYEAVENHSVTITRMWIEGRNSSIELPVLGNNIVAVEAISDNADAPTFDTENGDWTKLVPSGSSTNIMVHFDALVTCENGGSYTIPVNDARIKIKASKTKWESSCSYSYTLCLDATVLGLTEITFDPTVNDYVDVNVTR